LALASCKLEPFKDMIKKKTGKSWGAYLAYGCSCGSGGSKQPLDATDWCCHAHNCCYKNLVSDGCKPKKTKYEYGFLGDQIICGAGNSCERGTCLCDKTAAECFQRNLGSYRKLYSIYPNFLCKGKTPSC
ncbi:PA2GE phospholipase, partial [Catharus fuscescens]|nr:PA2GE phospholipase [Catharus fuscescens]